MHLSRKLALLACATSLLGCSAHSTSAAELVSIYRLVGNAEHYDKVRVSTAGVLDKTRNGWYVLYFDEPSLKNRIQINALVLDGQSVRRLEIDQNVGKYVMVTGVFHASSFKGLSSGTIRPVESVRPFPLMLEIDPIQNSAESQ
jgi:hypothetical protein